VSNWKDDPRLPYAVAALLGMIAGVAAKQAVALQSGEIVRPIGILADILVLGMVWLLVMYVHSVRPGIPLEGIALISAALAMWGPKGIAALLTRFKKGALGAADQFTRSVLDPIDPVHRPTVVEALDREKEEAMDGQTERENTYANKAPIRKLRDVIPPETQIPVDFVELTGKIEEVFKEKEEKENGNGTDH
jgi:hypothetical protein